MNYSVITHTRTAEGLTALSTLSLNEYQADLKRAAIFGAAAPVLHHWDGEDRNGNPMHVAWVADSFRPATMDLQVYEVQHVADAALRCDTIGCAAPATHRLTWSMGADTILSDNVCRPCGQGYASRPSFKATLQPLEV